MTDNVPEEKKKGGVIESSKTSKKCPIRFEFEGEDELEKLSKVVIDESISGKEAMKKVFGTDELELIDEIINRTTYAMGGVSREKNQNSLTQYLADCEPKNATEAKLYAQAHALFSQGMRFLAFARNENLRCHQEHDLKNGFKFLRLHLETLQTLEKLKRKEQKIIVQHVNVNEGGQAALMTGSFQAGGGAKEKSED